MSPVKVNQEYILLGGSLPSISHSHSPLSSLRRFRRPLRLTPLSSLSLTSLLPPPPTYTQNPQNPTSFPQNPTGPSPSIPATGDSTTVDSTTVKLRKRLAQSATPAELRPETRQTFIGETRAQERSEVFIKGLQGNRPVILVGFSLGAGAIFKCLQHLAETAYDGIVERVVLLGAPVSIQGENWVAVRKVVSGRFINAYSTNDWMLGVAFRARSLVMAQPAGNSQWLRGKVKAVLSGGHIGDYGNYQSRNPS